MREKSSIFARHDRHWRTFQYVYPVISRRSRGLSIGVNINPNAICNYDCVYCQVDRTAPRGHLTVDPDILRAELEALVCQYEALFAEPEFLDVPDDYRRLNDIAFSGDAEPTAAPVFPQAVRMAIDIRQQCARPETKIILITNACFLTRPPVIEALEWLDGHNGEIWAKLDAGTQEFFERVNRPSHRLSHVLDSILFAARRRPVVIQSLFMRLQGEPPPAREIDAYVGRLQWLLDNGGQIKLVQLYTVARPPAETYVSALKLAELERIARRVKELGIRVECFGSGAE